MNNTDKKVIKLAVMYQMHFLVQMFVYLINFFVNVHYYDYYLTVFFFVLFDYIVPIFRSCFFCLCNVP